MKKNHLTNNRFIVLIWMLVGCCVSMQNLALATPSLVSSSSSARDKKLSNQHLNNIKNKKITKKTPPVFSSPSFMSSLSSSASSSSSSSNDKKMSLSSSSSSSSTQESTKFGRLRQVSNFASILCVLDCTLLPIITVALPLLGVINLDETQMEFLHHLGHQLALYFVLPVGGLTTLVNFVSYKRVWIGTMATLGLSMIGFANAHIDHLPILGHVELLHTIQHGPSHRLVNIVGCALLSGSNYLSQQQGCAHDHGPNGSCAAASSSSHRHGHSDSH